MKYRHYKGGIYEYITDAHLEWDRDIHVIVYKAEDGSVWVRPRNEFFGYVEVPAPNGYGYVRRFENIPDNGWVMKTGCGIMECLDYKDGKCHYESAMCKYQESRMEGQEAKDLLLEAKDLLLEADDRIKELERDRDEARRKNKDYLEERDKALTDTAKLVLKMQDKLKRAEDILRQAEKLLNAVKVTPTEIYCEDIDNENWFDLADELTMRSIPDYFNKE